MRGTHHRQLEPRDFLILAILFVCVLVACWVVGARLMDAAKAERTGEAVSLAEDAAEATP
ncbi:hypothetical protein [Phyllobacterium endophyticum]|jgi:hypothetical protein|uniref:Uncharacterized protein n=1 Tax=Phyllobacterium endophyticum TaxID=1149773 RepID=A0A2P7AUE4_9HYPH|nr:hypothetical protein [Phyllobacterium endophyticum]MBB3234277.1 hypothetical protein [Phyllobacterium endophyticum]PSH57817.1 hypothetical protein CU100_08910 [Phyllobacterium endophyticum]TXR51181.1 hypothetical protein FVA77_01580 [Phyllobacterium endophyticum]TYR44019.1 hypothetical protein FY050_02265 [Phyllobacterium endophyticum]